MITSNPALFDALSAIPLLAGTNVEAHTLLAEEGLVHDFSAGTYIVREGDEGHAFFIIISGDVEVIKHTDQPHPVVIATLHAGTFFGELCVVDPVPRGASIRAVTDTRVIEIRAATLHHLSQRLPDQYAIVLLNLARDMGRRLRQLDEAYAARAG